MPKHHKHFRNYAENVPKGLRLTKGQTVVQTEGHIQVVTMTTPEGVLYELREGACLLWSRMVRFGTSKQFRAGGTAFQEAELARQTKLEELQ